MPDTVCMDFFVAKWYCGSQEDYRVSTIPAWTLDWTMDHSSSGSDHYFFNDFTADCSQLMAWYFHLRKYVWTYAVGLSDNYNYISQLELAVHPGPSTPALVGNDYCCQLGDLGIHVRMKLYLFGMTVAEQ